MNNPNRRKSAIHGSMLKALTAQCFVPENLVTYLSKEEVQKWSPTSFLL